MLTVHEGQPTVLLPPVGQRRPGGHVQVHVLPPGLVSTLPWLLAALEEVRGLLPGRGSPFPALPVLHVVCCQHLLRCSTGSPFFSPKLQPLGPHAWIPGTVSQVVSLLPSKDRTGSRGSNIPGSTGVRVPDLVSLVHHILCG